MRKRNTIRGITAAVGTFALALPVGYLATASAAAPAARHPIDNTLPSWAVPSRVVGNPSASSRLTVDVELALRNAAGANRLANSVSNPASALYGKYLTTSQFNARFAPTSAAVSSVEQYLRSQGLSIGVVPTNRRYIPATGSIAQVQKAFATTVHTYSVDGKATLGPAVALSVPSSLATQVLTVTGIGDGLMRPDHALPAPADTKSRSAVPPPSTCSSFWAQNSQTVPKAYGQKTFPTYICGYTAQQYQSAYGLTDAIAQGKGGAGTKVAILDAYSSQNINSDTNQLFTNTGEPTFKDGQFTQRRFRPFNKQALCGGTQRWNLEETLDVEAVHATAPGAHELYVGASNCGIGLSRALNWIVSGVDSPHSKAFGVSMVSNSYGNEGEQIPANDVQATNAILVQAAVEGVGVYYSSGDSGDESTLGHTATPQPDFPASSPFATAVGGTSLAVDSANGYQFETGWGTDLDQVNIKGQAEHGYQQALPGTYQYGAGGGTSTLFNEPWYQRNTVPPALAESFDGTRNRVVPDVAMDADPYTGMLEGLTEDHVYTQFPIGGTSLACPLFVGLQATTQGAGNNIGFANPTLYSLHSQSFRDIQSTTKPVGVTNTTGSYLVTLDKDSTLATTKRYDNVTGRGTPNGETFIEAEFAKVNQH